VFGYAQRLPHEIAAHRSAQAHPLNVAIIRLRQQYFLSG
jgi:hypothetical protein